MTTASGHPLVSIITPVYNTPKELFLACKNSVLGQTLTDFEWLLLDDASDGETAAMLDEAEQEDPRIHVHHLPRGGVSKARNFGLDTCRGTFLVFIDGDDQAESIFLEHGSRLLEENEADIAIGVLAHQTDGVDTFPPAQLSGKDKVLSGKELDAFVRFSISGNPLAPHRISDYFHVRPHQTGPRIYRKSVIGRNHYSTSMTLGEDSLFGSQVLDKANRIVLVDEVWYHYVQNSQSTVHKNDVQTVLRQMASFRTYMKVGAESGWQRGDMGMRFVSQICYKFNGNEGNYSLPQLTKIMRKLFRSPDACYFQDIDLSLYTMSRSARVLRSAIVRRKAFLVALLFRISAIRDSLKRR